MVNVPEEYVVSKFFQYIYKPAYNRYNKTYQGGCCVCNEGSSQKNKRRCYYIPKINNIYCHNCGWSSTPFTWVKKVCNLSNSEIIKEIQSYDMSIDISPSNKEEVEVVRTAEKLPVNSINLSDPLQIEYYKDNSIVTTCLDLVKKRRLNTAVNRSDLYVSLSDIVHKNRLVIPFYNEDRSIEFYQTRTILNTDTKIKPKYLSKVGADKTIFNIDKVTGDFPHVFIFEGPLNSMFTKNGVAVCGITNKGNSTFTPKQKSQVDTTLAWFEKIWVLDSQWVDKTSLEKSEILLKDGHNVFIWPEKFGKRFKDFNDICVACSIDEINHKFITENTFKGLEGIFRLSAIKRALSAS